MPLQNRGDFERLPFTLFCGFLCWSWYVMFLTRRQALPGRKQYGRLRSTQNRRFLASITALDIDPRCSKNTQSARTTNSCFVRM